MQLTTPAEPAGYKVGGKKMTITMAIWKALDIVKERAKERADLKPGERIFIKRGYIVDEAINRLQIARHTTFIAVRTRRRVKKIVAQLSDFDFVD